MNRDPDAMPEVMWATIAETPAFRRADAVLVEEWAVELSERLPISDGTKKVPGSVRGREFADAVLRILADYKRLKALEAAAARTRCSCSFSHPPHDWCDGNPDAPAMTLEKPRDACVPVGKVSTRVEGATLPGFGPRDDELVPD